MTAREVILLVDDDRTITEGLSLLLERRGRTTVVCSDTESAEVALKKFAVTHVISDVQFSGAFGFEGLRFLEHVRREGRGARIILMTGHGSDALRAKAYGDGAYACLAKPFDFETLERALASSGDGDGEPYEILNVPSVDEIIAGGALEIAFQPIVDLRKDCVPFAFEALARAPGLWSTAVDALFRYAVRRGKLRELNLHALVRAIDSAPVLPPDSAIFINLDPSTFGPDLPGILAAASRRSGIPLSRIVLEVTERSTFPDPESVIPLFEQLRAEGVRFALDDHGSAYSHLAIITRLQPSFVKISNTFGTDIENDTAKQLIVAHVAAMARDFGCSTVLEGIECQDTAREATRLGLDFAQGYHFGRPQLASKWNAKAA